MEKELKRIYKVYTEEEEKYYVFENVETGHIFRRPKKNFSLENMLALYGKELISVEDKRS